MWGGAQFLGITPGICTALCVPRQRERAGGFLGHRAGAAAATWVLLLGAGAPWIWASGSRCSQEEALPGVSRDSGHRFTSPFPSSVPMHEAGMCWIWEGAVSRSRRAGRMSGAWMDQHGLGMPSVTPERCCGSRSLPCVSSLASRGTLKPWRSFAAIPAGRIRSRGRAGPGSTSRIPRGRVPEGDGCSWEEDAVAGRGSSE